MQEIIEHWQHIVCERRQARRAARSRAQFVSIGIDVRSAIAVLRILRGAHLPARAA